jgi:putative membrane protein
MRIPVLSVVIAAACLSGGIASAAPNSKSFTDQGFVIQATEDGMAEVAIANMAIAKSSSSDVKAFAARMVQDHGNANSELASLGRSKHLRVPARINAKHQATLAMLQQQSGASFDAAYAKLMVADHAKAIALFTQESQSADADFAAFANKILPTLQAHKQMADDLSAKVGSPAT